MILNRKALLLRSGFGLSTTTKNKTTGEFLEQNDFFYFSKVNLKNFEPILVWRLKREQKKSTRVFKIVDVLIRLVMREKEILLSWLTSPKSMISWIFIQSVCTTAHTEYILVYTYILCRNDRQTFVLWDQKIPYILFVFFWRSQPHSCEDRSRSCLAFLIIIIFHHYTTLWSAEQVIMTHLMWLHSFFIPWATETLSLLSLAFLLFFAWLPFFPFLSEMSWCRKNGEYFNIIIYIKIRNKMNAWNHKYGIHLYFQFPSSR